MENKSHALAAGSFVLALLALLAGLVIWLARDKQEYEMYELSTADAISGLQVQATVRYKGVAVGKVTGITFDDVQHGHVLIRIAVDSKAPVTSTGTYGMLGYQGVTGIAHIQLDDVAQPIAALPVGGSGLPRLPMKSSPLTVLADQGMNIVAKVDEMAERINRLLGDGNQQQFGDMLSSMAEAADNVSSMTEVMNSTLRERWAPALDEVPAMAKDARRAMQALEQAGQQAGALAQEVRDLTAVVQGPGGTLEQLGVGTQSMARAIDRFDRSTLPALTQAAVDVSAAASSLERMVQGVGDNPQSLIYGNGVPQPGPGESGFTPPAAPAR